MEAPLTSPDDDAHPRRRTPSSASAAGTYATASAGASPAEPEAEPDVATLVRSLLARLDHLYAVAETANVVIADAVERAGADAGALLIPDDGRWRVAAGVQLRSLEHRCVLSADSWLVEHVALGQEAALISDTDSARTALQGAPLASWRHVLAAPVPDVNGVLVLARKADPPFGSDDLEAVAAVAEEAAPLLDGAVETRALARALREFRDEDRSAD